ncbi:UNVERIFIED_ORG: hypothetical protein M2328_006100 [Rhodococcus erythropolis]
MSEFQVGDIVAFDRDFKVTNWGYDGHWTVASRPGYPVPGCVWLKQAGRADACVNPELLRLVERAEDRTKFPDDSWLQSVYDGTMAQFGKVKIESKLVGCPVVMDFEDGRRSSGTITGVRDVKYDHGELLSYELTVEEFPRWSPTSTPKRVMHRASPGLRKPRPVDGVAFGWDRSRGMYSEALSMNLRSIEDWRKSLEDYRSQFSWLGAF